jgi:ATP-dependent DNA ligase
MLAKAGDPESIPGALAEIKLDGHRMVAFVNAGNVPGDHGVRMYARSGVDKTGKLPAIERELYDLIPSGTVLDGEVVHLDDKGGEWGKVQKVLGAGSRTSTTLTYVVFDVLQVMGEDVRKYTLASRRAMLEQMFGGEGVPEDCPHVKLVEQVPYTPEFVADLLARGFEGAIVKDPNGTYRSGARDWTKIKATDTEDVVVIGTTAGKGKFEGQLGALRFGQYDADRKIVEIGQCSGMTDAERVQFTGWHGEGKLVGTVIEVQHMGKMPTGGWRHPQFLRVRTDKRAEECVYDG